MSEDLHHNVAPEQPTRPSLTEVITNEEFVAIALVCAVPIFLLSVGFFVAVGTFLFEDLQRRRDTPGVLIVLTVVFACLLIAIALYLVHRFSRASLTRARLRLRRDEAALLSRTASVALASSTKLSSDLPVALETAKGCLRVAEEEFRERAFGPFWDAIERAALNLETFRNGVSTVQRDANSYYKALEGRQHSFPNFRIHVDALPEPLTVVEDLKRLVRKGQTDFQFANIWEHRRTRAVLIAGFRTLDEGLSNLGYAMTSALSELQTTLSSQLAEVVEQQIALHHTTREQWNEQGEMLDNIQRRREPQP